MSPGGQHEYFCDGMTEEIINALAKIKELRVTSRTSSFYYKGKNIPLVEIGKELGVSTIIEGSFRVAGNTIRITTQLINVEEDYHFWSETFDRQLDDVFSVQDEISLIIADRLREHIGHFEIDDHLVNSYAIPLSSYKKYLKGRFHLMKLDYDNTFEAISIFKDVIAECPEFPLPYLDINQGYAYMGTMGIVPAVEAFTSAQPFLEKGIALGPDLPETQLNLAWISYWGKYDLDTAYSHLNKALAARPSDAMYLTKANFLTVEGKLEAAMKHLDKALEIAPFSSINLNYKAFLLYMMERYDEALPYFERSLNIQPELPFPVVYIGCCYLLLGQHQKGLDYFNNLEDDHAGFLPKLGGTTMAHAVMGNTSEAEAGIVKLQACLQTESAGNALNFLVLAHAQMNDTQLAINCVQMGLDNRFPLTVLLSTEPLAKSLHQLPAFKKLLDPITTRKQKEAGRKYKKSLFIEGELLKYKERLEGLMNEDQLFLDAELSLRLLAEHMNLPSNHMSQLLNEGFNQNFSDFVNTYRLDTFKSKLAENQSHHLTLLALAYDSGFNSKTVFNTYFKKKEGVTPKAYWNQLKP
jgi:adenylate cyclase